MGRKRNPRYIFTDDDNAALEAVVTVTEARRMWCKADRTIRMAMDTGRLNWRRAGVIYLLTVDSLVHEWGAPKRGRD